MGGSSNFTEGGMARNVEFDYIGAPLPNEIKSITAFFEYCDLIANEVKAEVIQYYKNNQAKISELHHAQKKLTATLTGFTHQNDAFLPDDYGLDDCCFEYVDYETFFLKNRKKSGTDIKGQRERRPRVQDCWLFRNCS